MTVRQMSLAELEQIIDWAADEGWNPGLEDASLARAVPSPEPPRMPEPSSEPMALTPPPPAIASGGEKTVSE